MALFAAAIVAGCLWPGPTPDGTRETALYVFPAQTFTNSTHTFAFDLTTNFSYFHTCLTAIEAANATYNATSPAGGPYRSALRSEWPFVEELRVDHPAAGRWHITIGASYLEKGVLEIDVPASEVPTRT